MFSRPVYPRLVLFAAIAIAGCRSEPPLNPTQPGAASTTAARQNAGSELRSDPLSAWLPTELGACLVAVRSDDGRYPARAAKLAVPPELGARTRAITRFAYRGWIAGRSAPAVMAVCTMPDTPAAREFFLSRFSSRSLTPNELRTFALVTGVTNVSDWSEAERPHVMQGAKVGLMSDGDAMRASALSDDLGVVTAGASPQFRDGGVAQLNSNCDPNVIIQPPECGGETIPTDPPPTHPGPQQVTFSVLPSVGQTHCVAAALGNPHRSTTTGFAGRINFKAYTECPIPLSSTVRAAVLRQSCFLWVFCQWPIVADNTYSNVARTVQAYANTDCSWKTGWYTGRGVHTTQFPEGPGEARTYAPGGGWSVKIDCW
jgi:hypothetical protein